jgi:hypothetical protein
VRGPIDRYLEELSRRLPAESRRLLHEAADHLHEARERFVREGMTPDEAEERAVAGYGTVKEVAAAASQMGGPAMSTPIRRAASIVAFALTLPTLVFVYVNAIEHLAGNSGGIGVYQGTFDDWREQLNMVLTLGPAAAVVLIAMTSVRIRVASIDGHLEANVQIHLTRWMVVVAVLAVLVAVGVLAYLLSENVFCIPGSWEIC